MLIAVIEDDKKYRECLVKSLNAFSDCTVVHALNNALNITKTFTEQEPQLALVDINMPGRSGIDAVKEISENFPDVQCIMLTQNVELDIVLKCMEYGAKGYLVKDKDSIVKIVDSLRILFDGNYNEEFPLNGTLANKVLRHFVNKEKTLNNKLDQFKLTPRQQEVLKHLYEGKSYKQIAQDCNISVDTLNTHIKAIYPKLNIKSRGEINKFMN